MKIEFFSSFDTLVKSQFSTYSAQLAKSMYACYLKCDKLKAACLSTQLYQDESSREIPEMIGVLKEDLTSLKTHITHLNGLFQQNKIEFLNEQDKNHKNLILLSLESALANLSQLFKEILEKRTEKIKAMQSRREKLLMNGANAYSAYNSGTIAIPNLLEQVESNDVGAQSQMYAPQQYAGYNYMEEQANSVQKIESTIVELGDMFRQISFIVQEQEEKITKIDHNIMNAEMNLDAAHSELLKYFRAISGNRWLMVKVFGILFLFLVIFTIFR